MTKQLALEFPPAEESLSARPRNLKEVSAYYGVDTRVVRGWLRRYGLDDLAKRRGTGSGYYYTVAELRRMAEVLGE